MAFDLGMVAGIGKVLGGLFGKKKKDPTPAQNIVSQAQGAREAADKYGFNPLTMLQYGQPGGAMGGGGGGPSPLASIQMLTDGLTGLDDVISGDAARRRAADQLNLDLAQLKLDQARSGVALSAPGYAVNQFGPSPLGVRPVTVQQSNGGPRGGAREGSDQLHSLDAHLGDVSVPDPNLDRASPWYTAGGLLESPPGWTSPAYMEDSVWGENPVLSWPYGLAWTGAAVTHNVARMTGLPHLNSAAGEIDFFLKDQADRKAAMKKPKPLPEYYTHSQTGFTAKRRPFPY